MHTYPAGFPLFPFIVLHATVGPVPYAICLLLKLVLVVCYFCKSSFCSLHPSPISPFCFIFYPDPDYCSPSYYSSGPYSIVTPLLPAYHKTQKLPNYYILCVTDGLPAILQDGSKCTNKSQLLPLEVLALLLPNLTHNFCVSTRYAPDGHIGSITKE